MARARNKSELLMFGQLELEKLINNANMYIDKTTLIFDNRNVTDILSHILAWQELMITWYTEGMAGKNPQIPAPGYTFKTAPELNEKLYQDFKNLQFDEVLKRLNDTHTKLMKFVESHTEEELFTNKKYNWTGTTSMGCYFASAISSHYVWGSGLLKKRLNQLNKETR
jgi:hypothetical protein